MSHFLAELEIDLAIDEFLRARGVSGIRQPVVVLMDMPVEDDAAFERWSREGIQWGDAS